MSVPIRRLRRAVLAFVWCLSAFAVGAGTTTVEVAESALIRDCSRCRTGAGIGINGERMDLGPWAYAPENVATTAVLFAEAGVRLIRTQEPNIRFQGERAERVRSSERWHDPAALNPERKWEWRDPAERYSFWKRQGVKEMICLSGIVYDPETDRMTNGIAQVKKVTCDYLRWLIDHGYRDLIAGIEMQNEPYFGRDPAHYAALWQELLPEIRSLLPEVPIGIPIAIYEAKDPDLEAVRARGRKTDRLKSGKTHDQEHTRQWVGNAIAGLGDALTNVTHVIIHTYGADAWYTCGIKGIEKARFTQRAYPELAGKQLWITEWRDRSDEDWVCQRKFRTALFKAQYLLMTLGQRDVEVTAIHEARVLSGIFYFSNGEFWRQPIDNEDRKRRFPDLTGKGRPHAVTACAAGVYRLFNEALDGHPRILAYGAPSGDLSCTKYYESAKRRWKAIRKGAEELPPVEGEAAWVAAESADGKSLTVLAVNAKAEPETFRIVRPGIFAGQRAHMKVLSCEPGKIDELHVPGEPPWWRMTSSEVILGDGTSFVLPPETVATVVIGQTGT